MKKSKTIVLLAVLALAMSMILTACGSEFALDVKEDQVTVTAENSGDGDFAGSGGLVVGEGQQLVVEPAIENDGQLTLRFANSYIVNAGIDEDADELAKEVAELDADDVVEVTVSGTEQAVVDLAPAIYFVKATAVGKLTGTVTATVQDAE